MTEGNETGDGKVTELLESLWMFLLGNVHDGFSRPIIEAHKNSWG